MKVLFLYDDNWHPCEVIERGLQSFGNRLDGYAFDFVRTAKDILTPEMLKEYDVVVNAKGNQINAANPEPWFEAGVTEVLPSEFEAFARAGGGFLALHAGCAWWSGFVPVREPDRFTEPNEAYLRLIGAAFDGHPPRCEVTVYPSAEHPITRGVCAFTGRDEQYRLKDLAPDSQIFLRSRSEAGGEQIAGFTRRLGHGRLCVLTPGHTLGIWQQPDFQQLLTNAIDWCGGTI